MVGEAFNQLNEAPSWHGLLSFNIVLYGGFSTQIESPESCWSLQYQRQSCRFSTMKKSSAFGVLSGEILHQALIIACLKSYLFQFCKLIHIPTVLQHQTHLIYYSQMFLPDVKILELYLQHSNKIFHVVLL